MSTERPLTERQIEMLRLLSDGRTNEDIASILRVAKNTVTNTLTTVYARIGVENRVQAARWYADHCGEAA